MALKKKYKSTKVWFLLKSRIHRYTKDTLAQYYFKQLGLVSNLEGGGVGMNFLKTVQAGHGLVQKKPQNPNVNYYFLEMCQYKNKYK